MAKKSWNPRYECYARSQGRSPGKQLAHDRLRHGGAIPPYSRWLRETFREWLLLQGLDPSNPVNRIIVHEAQFDAWLKEIVNG